MTEPLATLHLIRHAESLWNVEARYQGQGDSGLTPRGHAQARELSGWLLDAVPHVDLMAASDLPRVIDTAAPTRAALDLDPVIDPRLRELDIGTWSGRLFTELARAEPELVAAAAAGVDVRRGGGETVAEMRARVADAIAEIVRRSFELSDAPTVLIFTHGGPIRVAVGDALGVPASGESRIGGLLNCSVTTLQVTGSQQRLVRFNVPTLSV